MFTIKQQFKNERSDKRLIITVSIAKSFTNPELRNWPETSDALIEEICKCYEVGASIAHIHPPKGEAEEFFKQIRKQCDIIIQAGNSSTSIPQRQSVINAKPDIISVNLNHHAKHFVSTSVDVLHPLKELEEYCKILKYANIKPEWGVWHHGSFWNLKYLIDKGLLDWCNPILLTYFFNWPGGAWSPPTYDVYMHRKQFMPENCLHTVSVLGEEQMKLLVFVLAHGGHIRVGTEDYPFLEKGKPAKDNTEIVGQYIEIAEHVGRKIATASEARKMLGL
ncbi:MAG: 3-keto-5-aminohexanoate cleavage protein [Promethearchaeota archaeon]